MKTSQAKKESWEYGFWFSIWNWFDFLGLIQNGGLLANRNFYPNLLSPEEYLVIDIVPTVMYQYRLDLRNSKGKNVSLIFTLAPEIRKGLPFKKDQKFQILSSDKGQGKECDIKIL